ncbi:hypothetical protein JAO29_12150 [Edaphobacter sp. HDX4]|uniref:hypothetical protein n=1 Tax=Edaphobacter sp. HDX4 TaxID=2794064 RepID=UPI002FE57267
MESQKLALALVAMLAGLSARSAPAMLHYGTPKTTLTGHLHASWQYGPPGFGETPKTDPKVSFVYIALDQSIEVSPNAGVPDDDPDAQIEKNVPRIRLWCFERPDCQLLLHTPSTCSVTLVGQLHHGVAPLDFYDVTMDVEDIQIGRCAR